MQKNSVLFIGALSVAGACGLDTQPADQDMTLDSIVVSTRLELPRCSRRGGLHGVPEGEVRYVARERKLYACVSGDWQEVSVGAQGAPGPAGPAGPAGDSSLVVTTAEPAGNNCSNGGVRIQSGLDLDGDGVLDTTGMVEANEVTSVSYYCNSPSVRTQLEAPGSRCVRGGFRVDVGNDLDGDGVLSDAEVTGSSLLCNSLTYLRVTAGQWHSCGLVSDTSVRCWGWNNAAELGDKTFNQSFVPVVVDKLSSVTAIAGGDYHTCALLDDTTVKCWGDGFGDEFEQGPGAHLLLWDVVSIAGGGEHAWALLRDGSAYHWSYNQREPRLIERLPAPAEIAGGRTHTCALLRDGSVRCWGGNNSGQLGNGTLQDSDVPVAVTLPSVKAIAAADDATCALLMDGRVACWGHVSLGELGPHNSTTPTVVPMIEGATAISVGTSPHVCAVLADGTARCWGMNSRGQLGGGDNSGLFEHVVGLDDIVAIDAGKEHSCAVTRDGNAYCWGSNEFGQLGDGTTAYRHTPGLVLPP